MKLRFENGPLGGLEVDVRAETTLGRAAGNGIVLDDPMVSACHARIVFRDGVAWIEDNVSTNGISVNGRGTDAAELRPGDRVGLGDSSFVVLDGTAPLTAVPAAGMDPAVPRRPAGRWPRLGPRVRRSAAAVIVLATLVLLANLAGCRRQPGLVLPATLRAADRGFKRAGVTLTVRETAGLERIAEAVTGGVPLPEGAVRAAAGLALLDAQGRPLPCQVLPQCHWPDGSIKWVLLDFQADLAANAVATYRLVRRKNAAVPIHGHPIHQPSA